MFMQLSRTREVPLRLHKSALPLWLLKPSRKLKETDILNHLQTVGMDEYPAEDPVVLNPHSYTSYLLPLHHLVVGGKPCGLSACGYPVAVAQSLELRFTQMKCSTQFSELQTREWVGWFTTIGSNHFPAITTCNAPRQITTTTTNHGEQHISCNFIFVSRSFHNLIRNPFFRKDRLIPTNKNSVHRIPALEILSPHKSLIQANTFPADSIPSFPVIASSSIEVQGVLLFSLAE